MSDEKFIKKIKTEVGNLRIDYNALGNLPTSDTTLAKSGHFADAKVTGDNIDRIDSAINSSNSNFDNFKKEINTWKTNHDHAKPVIKVNDLVADNTGNVNVYTVTQPDKKNCILKVIKDTNSERTVCARTYDTTTHEEFDVHYDKVDKVARWRYVDTTGKHHKPQIYDSEHQPPYPVTKVNGKTGDVQLTYSFTADLAADAWVEDDGGVYSQAVNIQGVTKDDNPIVDIDLSDISMDSYADVVDSWQNVDMISTLDGRIVVYCYERQPYADMTIRLMGVR